MPGLHQVLRRGPLYTVEVGVGEPELRHPGAGEFCICRYGFPSAAQPAREEAPGHADTVLQGFRGGLRPLGTNKAPSLAMS